VLSLAVILALFAIPAFTAIPTEPTNGTMVVAAVQGNANAGLFANVERGSILRNHIEATKLIPSKANGQKIDFVVWPENASDINPLADAATGGTIQRLVDDKLKVPLIFGTITQRGDQLFNSSLLWKPGVGVTDWYDKKRPVPFAEYVPDRDFWYSLAPDLIGLISHGYTFGTRDGIFDIGSRHLGVLICFEIAIDDISRDLVHSGAQLILSQTNNSDFGHSDETFQQVAIAKLRAIETGRAVVNDSTVGVSAVFGPDGKTLDQLPTFEPGVMVTKVPLRTGLTPAMAIGADLDLFINIAAFALTALALPRLRRAKKKAPSRS
jgi:apolipoprotein N-acyltransferase